MASNRKLAQSIRSPAKDLNIEGPNSEFAIGQLVIAQLGEIGLRKELRRVRVRVSFSVVVIQIGATLPEVT